MAHDHPPSPATGPPAAGRPGHAVVAALALVLVAAGILWLTPASEFRELASERPDRPRISERAGTMVRLSWQPVGYADRYEVTVSRGLFGAEAEFSVRGTEAQVPNLDYDTEYDIRVAAVDERSPDTDVTSRSSPAVEVRTLERGQPALLQPTTPTVVEARNTKLTIGWEPVVTAPAYDVQLSAESTFAAPSTLTTTDRRITFDGLDADTAYFARIRTVGARGTTSAWTPVVEARTILATDPLPLAVATYNVKCHSCGGPSWKSRKSGVVATIASRGLDVVGLQEAQQSGGPQFIDLLNELNLVQPGWEITSREVPGTLGVRIIYNTRTVRLLEQGSAKYRHQSNGDRHHQRYYVWGLFQQRASGKRFYFFNTHIEPESLTARVAQGRELAKAVRRMRGPLPAVAVGDFNASQFKVYKVHRAMTKAGMVDPLGVRPDSYKIGRRASAERRIHTNFDSFNGFDSRPRKSAGKKRNGKYIDYIFVTPMRVLEYENVANVDGTGRYRRAASDHNMLRAIVGLS